MSELAIPKHQPWFEKPISRDEADAAQGALLQNVRVILEQFSASKLERKLLPKMRPKHLSLMLRDRVIDDEPDGSLELQCSLQRMYRMISVNRREVFSMMVSESVSTLALNDLPKQHRRVQADLLASDYADNLVETLNTLRVGELIETDDEGEVLLTAEHVENIRKYTLAYYPVLEQWYERCVAGTLPPVGLKNSL